MMSPSVTRRVRALCVRALCVLAGGVWQAAGAPTAQAQAAPRTPTVRQAAAAASWLTRPERTDYAETSRYDEVIAYMRQMAAVNRTSTSPPTATRTRGARCHWR